MTTVGSVPAAAPLPRPLSSTSVWSRRENDPSRQDRNVDLPKDAEQQREFYFGKDRVENARFTILPDTEGHNMFDDLDLELDRGDEGKVAKQLSKAQVLAILSLIYRRLDQFLKTVQIEHNGNLYAKWQVKLEKKEPEKVQTSQWWKMTKNGDTQKQKDEIWKENCRSFALGGWSNQLRIVLRCALNSGPGTFVSERRRNTFRSLLRYHLPTLPPPDDPGEVANLRVRTRAEQEGFEFVDSWEENSTHRYTYIDGQEGLATNGFSWSWGLSLENAFEAQSRRDTKRNSPIDDFVKPSRVPKSSSFSPRRSRPIKPTFSDPFSIEVTFEDPRAVQTAASYRFLH